MNFISVFWRISSPHPSPKFPQFISPLPSGLPQPPEYHGKFDLGPKKNGLGPTKSSLGNSLVYFIN